MLEVVVSGAVTGLAIAVPIGAVGAYLVSLTARTSWRTGAAAALGVATVDGAYAAVAVLAGAAAAAALAPVTGPLRLVAGVVLLGLAAVTAWRAWRAWSRRPLVAGAPPSSATGRDPLVADDAGPARRGDRPWAAYLLFTGLTAVNPTTVVYFVAVVLGNRDLVDGPVEGAAFVAAAFAASAAWQLLLATAGAGLGRVGTGPRGRLVTGLVSSGVVAGLAVHTMLA